MEVCLSLIKDREVEKREIYRTQRTEQITVEIKWEFVYWHTPNTAFRHGWHRRVGTAYHWPWFISGWACSSNLQSLTWGTAHCIKLHTDVQRELQVSQLWFKLSLHRNQGMFLCSQPWHAVWVVLVQITLTGRIWKSARRKQAGMLLCFLSYK